MNNTKNTFKYKYILKMIVIILTLICCITILLIACKSTNNNIKNIRDKGEDNNNSNSQPIDSTQDNENEANSDSAEKVAMNLIASYYDESVALTATRASIYNIDEEKGYSDTDFILFWITAYTTAEFVDIWWVEVILRDGEYLCDAINKARLVDKVNWE